MDTIFSGTEYYAWLASACMPPGLTRLLLENYQDPADCHRASELRDEALRRMIPDRFCAVLQKNGNVKCMERMKEVLQRHAIGVLRYNDPAYPKSLSAIEQPPAFLFYQGNPECLNNRILSMVGSRAASYAGQKAAHRLSADLSRHGVTIVSGLACGIDTASHQGCIEGGSPTIAVTACGLDIVYPKENERLRDDILKNNGLILSEYAPGEKPAGWHFPFRNRIIAGMSRALVLIEARIRSGSMTSVQHALDQGKDVFVYPGDPDSAYFEGNHQLLREGGLYFTSAEDILSDLRWLDNQPSVRQNSDCSSEKAAATPEQDAVIRALKPGELSFEQLLVKTRLDPPELMGTLTVLQIRGIIESMPGKLYRLKY